MYAAQIKRAMQALFVAGAAGAAALALTQDQPVALFVQSHREAVWLVRCASRHATRRTPRAQRFPPHTQVGPLWAAFTGLAIKEGFCYGKPESAALAVLTPATLLGHLAGLPGGQLGLAGAGGALAVLAARKWTQPVIADIGNPAVWAALREEEARERSP